MSQSIWPRNVQDNAYTVTDAKYFPIAIKKEKKEKKKRVEKKDTGRSQRVLGLHSFGEEVAN